MDRALPKAGEVYKHFKGTNYEIICLANDAEDMSRVVVYRSLFDFNQVWIRKLDEFMSEVDKQKYPECEQKYRFEKNI